MNKYEINRLMSKAERIHFIGIGGISMSSLSMITKEKGYIVTGSDRTKTKLTERIENAGIEIKYFHAPENVEQSDLAVYTAAVRRGNPELDRAEELGIPICTRADYLGWLMSGYKERIGVAGTHGKSTVTSMISEIFLSAELDPTVVSGAELRDLGGAFRIGGEKYFIFEACEYCDSFLSFCPTTAVITNIEYDHTDYFKTMDQLRESFLKYTSYAEKAVLNFDDPESRELAKKYGGAVMSFALDGDADITPANVIFTNGCASFDIMLRGEKLCFVELSVPGKHNIADALAAAAASVLNGVSPEAIAGGLSAFKGAKRRFEYMGTTGDGALIYNDYAHHPSEIRAALAAAKAFSKRIVCVFQPHTYSRTASLFDEFAAAFKDADETIFADIYAAREVNVSGVSSEQLAKRVTNGIYLGSFDEISDYIKKSCSEGDIVMILGAGDIIRVGEMVLKS